MMRIRLGLMLVAVAALASAVSGCGSDRQSANVVGQVLRDGKPVANVVVRFQPVSSANKKEGGMASYGKTDKDGRFRLQFSDNDSAGALIGSQTVIIDDPAANAGDDSDAGGINQVPKSQLPAKWTNGTTRFEVKSGMNDAQFELSK